MEKIQHSGFPPGVTFLSHFYQKDNGIQVSEAAIFTLHVLFELLIMFAISHFET